MQRKKKPPKPERSSVLEQLERLDLDPVKELVEIARCEVRLSDEDLANPALQSLLSDYEVQLDPTGGFVLRPRLGTS